MTRYKQTFIFLGELIVLGGLDVIILQVGLLAFCFTNENKGTSKYTRKT